MSAGDEIMTPVTKPEAVSMAEIHAMRQMADAVSAQTKFFGDAMAAHTRAVERVADEVKNIDRRLIRVEEAKHGKDIERITEALALIGRRIDDLESTRDQQRGAKSLVDWLRQTAPWLFTLAVSALALLTAKNGAPS